MKYLLYKYEVSPAEKTGRDAHIRKVMKGTISVEHILPQNWQAAPAEIMLQLAQRLARSSGMAQSPFIAAFCFPTLICLFFPDAPRPPR